jgi:NADPH-dependent 2,4-dienoyl-CoA reductase/sulfur reductase-like enzyme
VYRARTALGPAGASWLRSRVEGQFPNLTGLSVKSAEVDGNGVVLGLAGTDGSSHELAADHVIAGTGYRTDLTRLSFFGSQIRSGLQTVPGTGSSVVGRDYQSSVPGLYVIGPAVAPTMGPVMRFVFGSEHAATTVARQLIGASAAGRSRAAVAAGR